MTHPLRVERRKEESRWKREGNHHQLLLLTFSTSLLLRYGCGDRKTYTCVAYAQSASTYLLPTYIHTYLQDASVASSSLPTLGSTDDKSKMRGSVNGYDDEEELEEGSGDRRRRRSSSTISVGGTRRRKSSLPNLRHQSSTVSATMMMVAGASNNNSKDGTKRDKRRGSSRVDHGDDAAANDDQAVGGQSPCPKCRAHAANLSCPDNQRYVGVHVYGSGCYPYKSLHTYLPSIRTALNVDGSPPALPWVPKEDASHHQPQLLHPCVLSILLPRLIY